MSQPLCRHFGPCGGCDWQNLSYAEQLERKRRRLIELFAVTLRGNAPDVPPLIGMPPDATGWPWRYRHKASYVFGESRDDGGLVIGHYEARSRAVVPIVECPVHTDRANRIAFALHASLARARVPAAGPTLSGIARHLIVRTTRDDRQAVAMLVVTRNDKRLRTPLRRFLDGAERGDGFFLNIHDRPGPYMVGRQTIRLAGHSHVRERVAGHTFLISPTAFFQTNVDAAERLVELVLHAIDRPGARVLDLYAGSGLFTLPLAAAGHRVTAVEENPQAVADAEENLRINRLRARPQRGRVETVLSRLASDRSDIVILDPPRDGCPPRVLAQIFGTIKPERAVYVSCNPDALAAELPDILARGYRITRVQPVDMFPHTTHIETVVVLGRIA